MTVSLEDRARLFVEFANVSGSRFANLIYKAKESGEVARHHLLLGTSIEELYQQDLIQLERIRGTLATELDLQACDELMTSLAASVTLGVGNNPEYTNKDTYLFFEGLRGLRMHRETGELYVSGISQYKRVITPGEYKTVKSRPLTIAKHAIRRQLSSSLFRQYSLNNIMRAALNGNVLVADTVGVDEALEAING